MSGNQGTEKSNINIAEIAETEKIDYDLSVFTPFVLASHSVSMGRRNGLGGEYIETWG